MSAAVAITPLSGAITAKSSACRIDVTGAAANSVSLYDVTKYPQEPQISYYLSFVLGGAEKGRSYVFAPNPDGTHSFPNYIFPAAGSWTVDLRNTADDSQTATASVTVS